MEPSLDTNYLGFPLKSPLIVGSCPMTLNPETARDLALAGAGAIVLPSLFEEQIVKNLVAHGKRAEPQEVRIFEKAPADISEAYNGGPQAYLDAIRSLKSSSGLPVIASLNGCTGGRWLSIAKDLQFAGADALEVTLEPEILDASISGDQLEQSMLDCITELSRLVSIPVSVKLTAFHTSLPNLAQRLGGCGAAGLVCFAHPPTFEISSDQLEAPFNWSLTPASSINQTIIGLLRVSSATRGLSVAASGGVASLEDVIRVLLAGADVVMLTSEVYRRGPEIIDSLSSQLRSYLEQQSCDSFEDWMLARPPIKASFRCAQIEAMTNQIEIQTETCIPPTYSGDRWGHIT